jgi:hypothetical protein
MGSTKQTPPDWAIVVADRYATRFLTHTDAATHFKHITHKAFFTRKKQKASTKQEGQTMQAMQAMPQSKGRLLTHGAMPSTTNTV